MKQFFLLLLFLSGGKSLLHATHIVGGEITYTCLGNDNYEIRLTVYRDCYNGVPWFDNPAYIGVYDASWKLVTKITVFWDPTSHDTLPVTLDNPCFIAPPDVCVNRSTYKATTQLPFRAGGYTLVYQRCCRNKLIRNLPDPLNTGISITAQITEQTLTECNSSAVFNKWPPVAICVHQPIDFDHSATDPDGDSLVYRLCTPLNGPDSLTPQPNPPFPGPYLEVQWNDPPYNLSNVLGGDPLKIDPGNGFMTGVPNTLGNFVVGVCVDEYRNGTVISTTRRDFQYNVADCGTPTAAFFVPEKNCENQPVQFVNQSIALFYQWYFDWENDPALTSSAYSPTFFYPDTGTYKVALITVPGQPCADTMIQEITVGAFHIDADMELELPVCDNNGLVIKATDLSMDSVYGIESWQWRLTGPSGFIATSSNQNHTFIVKRPGSYKLRLIAISEGGCRDTIERQFNAPIPRTDSLRAALTICTGDTVRLNSGAIPDYFYQWSPPQTLSDTAIADPLAFPPATTQYFVTITNANCTYEGTVTVTVVDTAGLTVSADPTTIYVGQSSQLEAVFPVNVPIVWSPPNSLSNPNIYNPVATPTQTTTYTATININNGCTTDRDVTVLVLTPFCDDDYVFLPTGFSPNGDGENDVLRLESRFAEQVYWAVYNRWGQKVFETNELDGAWDGTFKGEAQPAETYGFYLRAICPGGAELVRKGNVTLLR